MDALTSMIAAPLEAVSGLAAAVLPGTPTAAGAAGAAGGPHPTFTEDTLRMLVHNLFTGDSRLQQQMLSRYYASSATFSLNGGLLALGARDSLGQLLHGMQLLVGVEPEVVDITSSADRAVLLVNLYLTYRFAPWTWSKHTRVQVHTTITLTFGASPDALLSAVADEVITSHAQELSLPDLLWWNPAWPWLNARLWGPVSGRVLSGFMRIEEPLLGRFRAYLAGGAGVMQAAIWVAQDMTSGLASTSARAAQLQQGAGGVAAGQLGGSAASSGAISTSTSTLRAAPAGGGSADTAAPAAAAPAQAPQPLPPAAYARTSTQPRAAVPAAVVAEAPGGPAHLGAVGGAATTASASDAPGAAAAAAAAAAAGGGAAPGSKFAGGGIAHIIGGSGAGVTGEAPAAGGVGVAADDAGPVTP